MKSAIVTGATSFLGIAVLDALLKKGISVLAVVRPNSPNLSRLPEHERLHVIEQDMADISKLPEMVSRHFDVFYHLAWDGTRAPARDNEALQEQNYLSAMHAVRTAASLGCHTFIGAGSQAEYGKLAGEIDESCPANPLTAYGKAKLKTAQDGQKFAHEQGMRFIWPRIFSLYGKNDNKDTLVMSALKKMRQNIPIDLTACTQMWDFLYVTDAAQAYYQMGMSESANGIYQLASGESRQLKDFVLEMARITGTKSNLNFGAIPYPPEGVVSFEPVVNRLKQEMNWTPQVTFQEGIAEILYHMETLERHEHQNEKN